MSPEEVHAATQGRMDVPENMKRQWYLCGDIPGDLWDVLTTRGADGLAFRVSAFTSPSKRVYAVFSVQVEKAQIRFLLSLGASREAQFLSDASRSGILLSLARDNSNQAFIREFTLEPALLAPVVKMARASQVLSEDDVFAETVLATSAMCQLATIPSVFAGQMVNRACVITIFPEQDKTDKTCH